MSVTGIRDHLHAGDQPYIMFGGGGAVPLSPPKRSKLKQAQHRVNKLANQTEAFAASKAKSIANNRLFNFLGISKAAQAEPQVKEPKSLEGRVKRTVVDGPAADFNFALGDAVDIFGSVVSIGSAAGVDHFSKVENSAAYQGMNIPHHLSSLVTAYINTKEANQNAARASLIGDTKALAFANISRVREASRGLKGLVNAVGDTTRLAGAVETVGKTIKIAAGILSGAFSAAGTMIFSYKFGSATKALYSLKQKMKISKDEGLAFLKNSLLLTDDKATSVIEKFKKDYKHADADQKQAVINKLRPFKANKAIVYDLPQDVKDSIELAINTEYGTFNKGQKDKLKEMLTEEFKKAHLVQEDTFIRNYGEAALKAIKDPATATATDEVKEIVLNKAAHHAMKNMVIYGLLATAMALAFVSAILAQLQSAGAIFIANLAIGAVITALVSAVDFYGLYEAFKNKDATFKEKLYMVLMTIVTIASMIAANAVDSMGPVGLALNITFGALVTAMSLAGLYLWKKHVPEVIPPKAHRPRRADAVS